MRHLRVIAYLLLFMVVACTKSTKVISTNDVSIDGVSTQEISPIPFRPLFTQDLPVTNTLAPINTAIIPFATPSPPQAKNITPIPPSITTNAYPKWARLPQGKTLIIKHKTSYELMNYDTRKVVKLEFPSIWCPYEPLSTMQIVCITDDNQILLYNLLTSQESFLGITNPNWFLHDQTVYYLMIGEGLDDAIFALDLKTHEVSSVVPKLDIDNWDGEVLPVGEGKYFVVGKWDRHLYRVETSGQVSLISPPDLFTVYQYAVSPVEPIVAYGASNENLDAGFGPDPTDAYITNLETGETRHINLPIQYQDLLPNHSWPKWSPDGQRLAILLDYWVCIYNIHTKEENCIEIRDTDREISSTMTWSPDGKFIAFDMDNHRLALINIDIMEVEILDFDEAIEMVFWK